MNYDNYHYSNFGPFPNSTLDEEHKSLTLPCQRLNTTAIPFAEKGPTKRLDVCRWSIL
ncbi:Uncharacterised protein [Legionella feeleii]|uniref:Uncharacterized protein n=1 Tax=Legionella feeleii TaxID=453 RepID=A0A378IVI3_9GAMM|nr:Uncharacterised protein [Legionella feeleii]